MQITEAKRLRSEREPMRGRVVLITGGAAGTGLEIARELDRLGAVVVVGTRNLERLQRQENFIREPIPFVADLTNPDQVRTAISSVRERGITQFTDVISCAAGGIEEGRITVGRIFISLRKIEQKGEKVPQEKINEAKKTIEGIVSSGLSFARNINVFALQGLVKEIREGHMIGKGHLIQLSSLPSSFFGKEGVSIPSFYRGVAETKHEAEVYLTEQAEALANEGIITTIISGDVVGDSAIGKLYTDIAEIFYSKQEMEAKPPFITEAHMAEAVIKALMSEGKPGEVLPRRVYVLGDPSLSPSETVNLRALPL